MEVLESKPYIDEATGEKGIYSRKIYHLDGYLPSWLRTLAPSSALQIHEEVTKNIPPLIQFISLLQAWERFPYCKTIITNPLLGDKFQFDVESWHVENDTGRRDDVVRMADEKLRKKRKIDKLNIAVHQLSDKKYISEKEDPTKIGSKKANKKPLTADDKWMAAEPVMCAYKLVTMKAKIWGIQKKCEAFMLNMERDIFLRFHKQMFCWLDDWYDMTMEEVEAYENQMAEEMNSTLQEAQATQTGKDEVPQLQTNGKDL